MTTPCSDCCSEISKQVFPVVLDTDAPAFRKGFARLTAITDGMSAAKAKGGALAGVKRAGLVLSAAATLVRLFLLPVKRNVIPAAVRIQPAW